MEHFKEKIVNQCLRFMKREDVKEEIKNLMRPMIDTILNEIFPYIYLCLIFLLVNFLLILAIFLLLLKKSVLNIPTIFSISNV